MTNKLPLDDHFSGTWKCQDERAIVINDLRKWTTTYNVPQAALKSIIKIVNKNFHANLPTDPRTLMKTPRSVSYSEIGNGINDQLYWHQGLEICLRNCFNNITQSVSISININIDGLPLHKSTHKNFWPVLFNIHEYPSIHPMAIGIFYGDSKPDNVTNYLTPFVQEIEPLLKNGLEVNGHKISIRIRCFVCDSPARAFIKGWLYFRTYIICLYLICTYI